MLKTRAVILADKEVTYGTDPTPLPASNAVLCEAPEIEIRQVLLRYPCPDQRRGGDQDHVYGGA
jgi:hypothetical protein